MIKNIYRKIIILILFLISSILYATNNVNLDISMIAPTIISDSGEYYYYEGQKVKYQIIVKNNSDETISDGSFSFFYNSMTATTSSNETRSVFERASLSETTSNNSNNSNTYLICSRLVCKRTNYSAEKELTY